MNEVSGKFKKLLKVEVRGASIYTFATFLTQFGSFLIVPFFWQKLSLNDYGIIGVVEIIGSFLGMFLGLQLDISITRFFYEWEFSERKWRVGNIWVLSSLSTLIIGGLSIRVLSLVTGLLFSDVDFYPYIFLGLVSLIISRLTVVPFAAFRIINMPILYAVLSTSIFLIQSGLNIYYVLILESGVEGYFVSNILGSLISLLIVSAVMFRFAKPCLKYEALKEPLQFSLPQIPASIISGLSNLMDRFLLQKYASLEILGIYALCLKFTNLVLHLHNSLKISFVPFMIKTLREEKMEGMAMVKKIRILYLVIIMAFGLSIVLFIKDFVSWIDKSEYYPIIEWMPYLIFPVIISTFTVYLAPGLFLSKRSDLSWIPAVGQLLIVFVSGIMLIPEYKMSGVIYSRYLSVISLFLITFYLSQKYYPIAVNWNKLILLNGLIIVITVFSQTMNIENILISISLNFLLLSIFLFISLIIAERISFKTIKATITRF
jgi:O-antigen/teichoic acid export membrane protein